MRSRFVIATRHDRHTRLAIPGTALDRATLERLSMTIVPIDDGTHLAVGGPAPVTFPGGAIVGTLFRNGQPTAVTALSEDEIAAIERSAGQSLIDNFWGAYVAILTDRATDTLRIVRAPFGELPCLFIVSEATLIAASDPALLVALGGYVPAIDWTAVGWHFGRRDLRFSRTCLDGVDELHGGNALTIASRPVLSTLWSPWTYVARRQQFRVEADAIAAVRRAVLASVRARVGDDRAVLLLSGGIDSSIVAAALAAAGAKFDCLTLTTRDEAGDEREFAALASASVGRELHTARREVTNIDVTRSEAARMARPVARAFAQETRRAALELARSVGARCIVGGGGGDNVFCALQSGGPAADSLLMSGPGRRFYSTAAAIAQIASVPVTVVLRDALRRVLRRRGPPGPFDTRLLGPAGLDAVIGSPEHPWFNPPRGALPGSAGHIRLLAYAQSFGESFDPLDEVATMAPLLSQPVVEACLRVPSPLWFDRARNRMIARRAFERELPPSIFDRRSKGSPESFVGEIFERNRVTLKSQLLDGALAAHQIIDRDAIEALLDDQRPAHGSGFMRILEFADAEAWISCWLGVGAPGSA
jgi:asparagine synthase (glutamine-hydrolysing)